MAAIMSRSMQDCSLVFDAGDLEGKFGASADIKQLIAAADTNGQFLLLLLVEVLGKCQRRSAQASLLCR